MVKLYRDFFIRPALIVARDLLGKFIVRNLRDKKISGMIVETEAYTGPKDKASHAYNNKITLRNYAEYMVGGHIYIYLVYGMYWQLNITSYLEGKPECVLIRALQPSANVILNNCSGQACLAYEKNLDKIASGPGKVCQYLKVDKSFYGEDVTSSEKIYLEDRGIKIQKGEIVSKERIGIDYAKEWAKKPLRYYIKNSPFVSRQ